MKKKNNIEWQPDETFSDYKKRKHAGWSGTLRQLGVVSVKIQILKNINANAEHALTEGIKQKVNESRTWQRKNSASKPINSMELMHMKRTGEQV